MPAAASKPRPRKRPTSTGRKPGRPGASKAATGTAPRKTRQRPSGGRVEARAGISVTRHDGPGYAVVSAWEPFGGHDVQCHTVDDSGAKYGLVGTRPNTDRAAEAARAFAAIVAEHPDAAEGERRTGYVRITVATWAN